MRTLRARNAIVLSSDGVWIGVGCVIAFMIMPVSLFGTYFVDVRMVIPAVLILPSFMEFTDNADRFARWSAVALLTAMATMSAVVTLQVWLPYQRDYAQLLESFNQLKRFSHVLVTTEEDVNRIGSIGDPLRHAPTLAAAYSGALVPSLFAIRGSQPIRLRQQYREYDFEQARLFGPVPISVLGAAMRSGTGTQIPSVIGAWREKFDYLYVLGASRANPFPAVLTQVAAGDRFTLYCVGKSIERKE
jgi:hypothetical protein